MGKREKVEFSLLLLLLSLLAVGLFLIFLPSSPSLSAASLPACIEGSGGVICHPTGILMRDSLTGKPDSNLTVTIFSYSPVEAFKVVTNGSGYAALPLNIDPAGIEFHYENLCGTPVSELISLPFNANAQTEIFYTMMNDCSISY